MKHGGSGTKPINFPKIVNGTKTARVHMMRVNK